MCIYLSSVLDYSIFCFWEAIVQQCFWIVLADVGGGNENEVCMHNTHIMDVAFACRRVGSKRVKVLSSCKRLFYNHLSSCRQAVLLQRSTFVLNVYICCCFCTFSFRAYDEGEYIESYVCFTMMLFASTNKFKVLITMTNVKMKYDLGMS